MNISVIIPAWNEENNIGSTIKSILGYFKKRKLNYEIIVVNDFSDDSTEKIVRQSMKTNSRIRLLKTSKRTGKGGTVKMGMLAAKYPLAMFMDADSSTSIEELDNFLKYIDDYDIIIGSRSIKGANVKVHQNMFREILGKTFNKIIRIIGVRGIIDTQCGFKLFKNCKPLFRKQTIEGWAFDVEILFIARKMGKKIKELPVTWANSKGSKLNPFTDSIRMLLEVIKIRINNAKGMYR